MRPLASLIIMLAVLCLPLSSALAQEAKVIKLPAPQTEGGMPLMQALKNRHTTREFAPRQLEPQMLSDLLWAAFGINRPDSGRRTAPSAMNWQEVDIYVVQQGGTYLWEPKANTLTLVSSQDLREAAGKQGFVATAPVNLLYVSDLARTSAAEGQDKDQLTGADVGFIGQNVYLFCASQGLNTVVRAGMDRETLTKALSLKPTQKIILAQTVGYPK